MIHIIKHPTRPEVRIASNDVDKLQRLMAARHDGKRDADGLYSFVYTWSLGVGKPFALRDAKCERVCSAARSMGYEVSERFDEAQAA